MAQKSGNLVIPDWYLWTVIVLNLISAIVVFVSDAMTAKSQAWDYFLYGYTFVVFLGWLLVNIAMLLELKKRKATPVNYLLPGYYIIFMLAYVGFAYLMTYRQLVVPESWYNVFDIATSFLEVAAAIIFLEMKKHQLPEKEKREEKAKGEHDEVSDEIARINETVRRYSTEKPAIEKTKKQKKKRR